MVTPKQVRKEEPKEEEKETIWHKIISLIEHGRKPTRSMDEYLALGMQREKGRHLGNVVVKKEKIELKVTPTAVAEAETLRYRLDEAARHEEQLFWPNTKKKNNESAVV